ncbi:hypothetical protein Ae201684_015112 [Aphanomyces euteiches]|uniref:Uncharacterized protein n=1 Tax=Aphanomyces euteiches TaxID=100861 RepID=A0A6G0WHR6_9STRA|nr:hypothetical protein Ae201684_015112 [Aphanomyces euteiches]
MNNIHQVPRETTAPLNPTTPVELLKHFWLVPISRLWSAQALNRIQFSSLLACRSLTSLLPKRKTLPLLWLFSCSLMPTWMSRLTT